jgi:hypothetical protein
MGKTFKVLIISFFDAFMRAVLTMSQPLSFKTQVNLFGGAIFLIIGGYAAFEMSRQGDNDPCNKRYPAGMQMSLARTGGAPLAPGELQASVGVSERGLIEKASVVRTDLSTAPLAMEVQVGGPLDNDTGVTFAWTPKGVAKAEAVCLSYQVYAPKDFEFARGGQLPGFVGGQPDRSVAEAGDEPFSTLFMWDGRGSVGLGYLTSTEPPRTSLADPMRARAERASLPRGRWFDVQQEIKLNSGSAADGLARVWVDGRLVVVSGNIAWRSAGGPSVVGVRGAIGYSPIPPQSGGVPEAKPSTLRVSPLRLSWK